MRGRVRLIGAAAIALVGCLIFYMFFIRPRKADLSKVNTDIAAAEAQTQSLRLEVDRLQTLKDNAPELNALLEEIRGYVPKEDELPNFIFQVEEAADAAGVSFVKITPELPKPPATATTLAEIRITIDATGGFFSLQDFVRRLYSLDRALRVDTLSLSSEGGAAAGDETTTGTETTVTDAGGGDLTLSIAARIFFEIPANAPVGTTPPADPNAPPADGTTPAPGETAPPAAPEAPETTAPESPAPAP